MFPPPITWIPSNCILEVDDILKEWTWEEPFDFIHMRTMLGAFTAQEWDDVYKQCYECAFLSPETCAANRIGIAISNPVPGSSKPSPACQ